MRGTGRMRNKRGITPVVATIILSAVVIAVGGAVWSYSQGAATVIANDYMNGTMSLLNEVIERFTVEHVRYYENNTLRVWIFNYGDVDIVVDVYATITEGTNSSMGEEVASEKLVPVDIPLNATSGDEVAIKVHSRRQNNAYYTYYVP